MANSQKMRNSEHTQNTIRAAKRIVVKFGTRVLVDRNGRPNPTRMRKLVHEIAALHKAGKEVVLVSSGAIGAGLEALHIKKRPSNLPDLQMAAAVGQSRLMNRYAEMFAAEGCQIGQVLLTHDDLKQRTRHLNARNTLLALLRNNVIPIVNENDVISVDEIALGDNDELAALVTILIDGDVLALMTSVDGLRAPATNNRTKRVPYLAQVDQKALDLVFGSDCSLSTGGMATKLAAARSVNKIGALALIADGRKPSHIGEAMAGEDRGTLIGRVTQDGQKAQSKRKNWIAFFHKPQGAVVIDDGAGKAILQHGKSLLPIGVKKVEGDFPKGAVLQIKNRKNHVIAQGLTDYSSDQVKIIKGKKTKDIAALLDGDYYDEVIHRDNMAILEKENEST